MVLLWCRYPRSHRIDGGLILNLAEYRRAQDVIARGVVRAVVSVLRSVAGVRLDQGQFGAVVDALLPSVLSARSASAGLAREVYAAERARHSRSGRAPVVGMPHYERAALEDVLARTVKPALLDTDPVPRATVVQAATAVARHVEMAGRETLIFSVESDRAALGWARVLTGRENCAFCAMLASRGPVYTSESSALVRADGRRFHDGCDCLVVAVFDRSSWPGKAQADRLFQFWQDSTRGQSGGDAVNAFRSALLERGSIDFAATVAA